MIKKKTKIIFIIMLIIIFALILGLSYGTFIVNTDKYNASELLVSNLLYGIDLKNTDGSKIEGKVVTTNEVKTVHATITSLNPVDSNYSLEYKIINGSGRVYYSETTGWKPNGTISKDGGIVYVKTVKVVLVPNTTMTVEFNVNGGYSYNSELLSMNGYNKITEEYKDTSSSDNEEPLVDVVKKDNNCSTSPCLYGGESKNNYLQYPTASNTTDNIWRIIGNIDNGIKAVSNITGTTTQSNIVNSLNTFYGSLPNTDKYLLKTNNFNCTDSGCTGSSKFNNIGLISTYEYNKVGGSSSYLANSNNFFSINNDNIENITTSGVEQTDSSTSSGLRPTVYLKEDVNVTGSGTASDPYRIYSVGKVITVKYTKNGTPVTDLPSREEYIVNSVTCTGGRVGRWDDTNNTVVLTKGSAPTTCTVDFKAGYTVTMKASDGTTIGTPPSKVVGRIGETSFTFSTTSAYDLSKASVSCVGGASGNVSGNTINITNVTSVNTCTLTIPLKTYAVNISSNDETMGTVSVDKTIVEHGGTVTIKLFPNVGYKYLSNNCNLIISNNTIILTNITENKTCIITFIGDTTLAGTIKKVYPNKGERNNFNEPYILSELHTAPDDQGISYYFTGNPNNWVKFANFYWRIIRINGDNSVRLLYAGTGGTDGGIGSRYAEESGNSSTGSNYAYWKDGDNKSIAYQTTEAWYNKNIINWDKYINSNSIYCSDVKREYINELYTYGSYRRLVLSKEPTFKCTDTNNKFQDKFGLMTADEIVYAGGIYDIDVPAVYFAKNLNTDCTGTRGDPCSPTGESGWYTMSPAYKNYYGEYFLAVAGSRNNYRGKLTTNANGIDYISYIRPVISLKSCVEVINGNGTGSNPYQLTISETCATAEN